MPSQPRNDYGRHILEWVFIVYLSSKPKFVYMWRYQMWLNNSIFMTACNTERWNTATSCDGLHTSVSCSGSFHDSVWSKMTTQQKWRWERSISSTFLHSYLIWACFFSSLNSWHFELTKSKCMFASIQKQSLENPRVLVLKTRG